MVPPAVKADVLAGLTNAGVAFEAVSDLCQLSARNDPRMKELAEGGPVTIAACYPRAVRGLFIQSETPLPDEGVTICNMRTDSAEDVLKVMLNGNAAAASASAALADDALSDVPAVPLPLVSKTAMEAASLAAPQRTEVLPIAPVSSRASWSSRRPAAGSRGPGHRLHALHQLHAVSELLPVRRLRRQGRQDSGPEPGPLQDRLPGLFAGLPGSGDHVPGNIVTARSTATS